MPRDRRAVIGTAIWTEPSVQALPYAAQHAYFLAYTQPDLSRCGVVPFRPQRWVKLAKDLTVRHLTRQFTALHDTKHVILDHEHGELLIRTYVGHDGLLAQPLVVAAMVRDYSEVASDVVRHGILAELRRLYDLPAPKVTDAERKGLLLLLGADPADLGIAADKPAQLDRIRGALDGGLATDMRDAIHAGHVDPYPDTLLDHLPDPLAEGLTEGHPDPLTRGRSRVAPTPVPTPTPPPSPGGSPDPQPDDHDGDHDHQAEQLLDDTGPWTDPLRNALHEHVTAALTDFEPAGIKAALADYRSKLADPKTRPGLLPYLIQEHAARLQPAQPTRPPWCGNCEPETRLILDDNRDPLRPCPECKP